MKLLNKLHLWILMVALIAVSSCLSVSAATEFPDLSKNGSCSIKVTIKDKTTDQAVTGGKLELFQVASVAVDNGYVFVPAGAFDKEDFTYDLSQNADLSSPDLAKNIASYASKNGITGNKQASPGQNGATVFDGLDLGLYLIIEAEAAPGYSKVQPFLVTIPMEENGAYVYDVDASPKPEKLSTLSPVTVTCPEVKKVITVPEGTQVTTISQEYMSISPFEFSIKRNNASYPMPVNTSGSVSAGGAVVSSTDDELVLRHEGTGTVSIGSITFTEPGDYYYTVKENETKANYDFDRTTYVLIYKVARSGDKLVVTDTQIRASTNGADANGESVTDLTFTFTNKYSPDKKVVNEEEEVNARKTNITQSDEEGSEDNKKTNTNEEDEGTTKKVNRTNSDVTSEETLTEPPRKTTTTGGSSRTSSSTSVSLPQTGQLWWPVWILVAAGAAFLLIGILRRFKSR